ncbi:MAG: hypothetical protein K2L08_04325 [Erysipelotrichaceae bacterium]|nr:hypothetical protein [Erysipelotrichaceae bacterium]
MRQLQKNKLRAFVIAGFMSVALLVTGTFAWSSISQTAENKFEKTINPGARLHDDFNGVENKDIYIENYTGEKDGTNIFARIKLKEYMEIGETAGMDPGTSDSTSRTANGLTIVGSSVDPDTGKVINPNTGEELLITDPKTWHTHELVSQTAMDLAFREYWSWEMGNADTSVENYYMPTFNKDKDNLEADINGTLEGNQAGSTVTGPYSDYKKWEANMTSDPKVEAGTSNTTPMTHTTKKIEDYASVISMRDYHALSEDIKKQNAYWVYDNDGWAYYSKPIEPGQASGLLLNKVNEVNVPEEKYHYRIYAIGEFATIGDWEGFKTSQYGGLSKEGEEFLNTITNRLPKVVYMTPVNGFEQMVTAGSSLSLDLNINVQNATGAASEKAVEWTINDEKFSHTIEGSRFTPTADMAGKVYVLTGKSKLTPTVTTTIRVTVLPLGADDSNTIIGEDGNPYVSFGFNIYKRVEKDGTLSNYICAGIDQKPGSDDDKTNVYELKDAHPTYGKFFLKKEENRYYWMEADKLLGTADDELLGSATNDWPNNITDRLVDRVKVMTFDGETENVQVKIGKTKQFKAEVYFANELISNQKVTWQISGNKSTSTTISEDGLLTLGLDEPEGTALRIIATSTEGKIKQANNILVMVSSLGYEDIRDVEVQGTTTIKIGNVDYYVLENDGEKALLWAKNSVHTSYFGNGNHSSEPKGENWEASIVKQWLNETFYNDTNYISEAIKDKIIETTLYTRYYTSTSNTSAMMVETTDHIFLLSYEDLGGLHNDLRDERLFTGSGQLEKAKNLPGDITWLRTNFINNGLGVKYSAMYLSGGVLQDGYVHEGRGLRPAFWIKLPETTNNTTTPDNTNP